MSLQWKSLVDRLFPPSLTKADIEHTLHKMLPELLPALVKQGIDETLAFNVNEALRSALHKGKQIGMQGHAPQGTFCPHHQVPLHEPTHGHFECVLCVSEEQAKQTRPFLKHLANVHPEPDQMTQAYRALNWKEHAQTTGDIPVQRRVNTDKYRSAHITKPLSPRDSSLANSSQIE